LKSVTLNASTGVKCLLIKIALSRGFSIASRRDKFAAVDWVLHQSCGS
jgi:hypothetical protein